MEGLKLTMGLDVHIGKPIDIKRFKQDALQAVPLAKIRREFKRVADFVLRSKSKVRVKSCYVCDSRKNNPVATVYGMRYLKCARCGHVYAEIRLDGDAAEKYYRQDQSYSNAHAHPKTYEYRLREIASPKIDFVKPYVKTKRRRWLDVGSGSGDIVVSARRHGFDAHGIEISETSVRFAKKVFGVELHQQTLDEFSQAQPDGSWDIVSFFGVLEHIPDPKKQVLLAKRLLSKNGLLVIEVPSADSISALSDFLYGDQVVRHMYPPFHIMAFTRKSLLRFASNAGFKPEALWYFGLDFYNMLVHWGMQSPAFFKSALADFLITHSNEFQDVIDRKQMSDELVLVARKA